jgi:3-deoxy-D-manno-octulosonic acid kinase
MARAAPSLPAGFVRLASGSVEVVVDAVFAQPLERLGLLAPGGLARALAGAGGPTGRGRVAVLPLDGASARLCLRPLRRGGWLGAWLPDAFSSLARPLAELTATARLRSAGAPVPRPLLVIGDRREGGGFDAAVGTLFEEGTVDALHFLEERPDRERLLRAAAAAGVAVRRFHDAGGRHADLHVKNLLLRERPESVDALVIDLDHARIEESVTPRARLRELMRLQRSLVKRGVLEQVGARGCARFFAAYAGGDRALRRALRAGLPQERLRLALHRLHYR